MTLSWAHSALVEIAQSLAGVTLTSGYLMFVPLGREHASTLRIKVGAVGCAAPVSEPTSRVVIDVSVADEVRLAVQRLRVLTLAEKSARNTGETYMDGTGHIHVGVQ